MMFSRRIGFCFLALLLVQPCVLAQAGSLNPERQIFHFRDGGTAIYYTLGSEVEKPETFVFMYGGSGCFSYRDELPRIAEMMGIRARYIALNKRAVADNDFKVDGCSQRFYEQDNPRQWVADYMEFLTAQLSRKPSSVKNVVLLGMSEGGALAARVARSRTDITHLMVIGDGGWSMRENLDYLMGRDAVDAAWRDIASDPASLRKTWLGHPYRYWFDILDQTPLQDYLALDIPVLIGVGERDASVPAASAIAVKNAADQAGKRNIGVVVYPGADHLLNAEGQSFRAQFLHGAAEGIASGNLN